METVACPKCGKMFKKSGLGGHLFGVHMIRTGPKWRAAQLEDSLKQSQAKVKELELSLAAKDKAILGDSSKADVKQLQDKIKKARDILSGDATGYKYHDDRDAGNVNKALAALH